MPQLLSFLLFFSNKPSFSCRLLPPFLFVSSTGTHFLSLASLILPSRPSPPSLTACRASLLLVKDHHFTLSSRSSPRPERACFALFRLNSHYVMALLCKEMHHYSSWDPFIETFKSVIPGKQHATLKIADMIKDGGPVPYFPLLSSSFHTLPFSCLLPPQPSE